MRLPGELAQVGAMLDIELLARRALPLAFTGWLRLGLPSLAAQHADDLR